MNVDIKVYLSLVLFLCFLMLSCNKDYDDLASGTIEFRYNNSLQTIRSGLPMPADKCGYVKSLAGFLYVILR